MAGGDPKDPIDPTDPDDPTREHRPGELEHASSEVDEFEAATRTEGIEADEGDDESLAATPATKRTARAIGGSTKDQSGPRALLFLRACWDELQRVQWPDRRQVGQATAVVLGFVVIAGAFLGVADIAARELVDLII